MTASTTPPRWPRADVGVAIGARGSTASSEAADVVLTVDRLDRLGEAITIARRARARSPSRASSPASACRWSPWSSPPSGCCHRCRGACSRRASTSPSSSTPSARCAPPSATPAARRRSALVRRFTGEHRTLRPDLDQIRGAADRSGPPPHRRVHPELRTCSGSWSTSSTPHEQAEDPQLYPVFDRVLGGSDPTGTMSRAHVEIAHLIRRIGHLIDDVAPTAPDPDDLIELRRFLYGLHAILLLHFAQEDEGYLSLADDDVLQPSIPSGVGSP